MPPGEAGAKLLKTNAISDDFYVLYKKTSTDNRYSFAVFYNPANEYDENYIAAPFTSTYDRAVFWNAGTVFSNILHSAEDCSKVYYGGKLHSWKEVSTALSISWRCLAQRDTFYDEWTQAAYVPTTKLGKEKFICSDYDVLGNLAQANIVGGHTILSGHPSAMSRGSADVYIVPICKHHNSLNLPHKDAVGRNRTPGNGNGFFMRLGTGTNVIKLKGYLEPPEK